MRRFVSRTLPILGLVTAFGPRPALSQIKASGIAIDTAAPALIELRHKDLLFPVLGISIQRVKDNFRDPRDGQRRHNALDIPAPRGTPVLSTDSGRVLKLYRSKAGGLMVYTADPSERYIYYYAHLDRYRDGLREGMRLMRGDTIGFVGTTGNAPPGTPHLHFAILRSKNIKRWSRGTPINPFEVFSRN